MPQTTRDSETAEENALPTWRANRSWLEARPSIRKRTSQSIWDEDQARLELDQARENWGVVMARRKVLETGVRKIDGGQKKIASQNLALTKTTVMRNKFEYPKSDIWVTALARRSSEEPWANSRTATVTWGGGTSTSQIYGPAFSHLERPASPLVTRTLAVARFLAVAFACSQNCHRVRKTKRKQAHSCSSR